MGKIIIGDCEYAASGLELYLDLFCDLQNSLQLEDAEQRKIIAKYIYDAIDDGNMEKPSLESIADQIDDIFEKNIDIILQKNDYLIEYYNQAYGKITSRENFLRAIDSYWKKYLEETQEILAPITASWSSEHAAIQEELDKAINNLMNALDKFAERYSEYETKLAETLNILDDFISHYDPHAYDENYKTWATWGWSVIGHAPIRFYGFVPKTKEQADFRAMEYFKTNEQMNALFNDTSKYGQCKIDDYQEAIRNYKSENYKSCALMLFSLTDGLLINNMETDKRKPGIISIKHFEKVLQNHDTIVNGFALRHWYISVIACLNEVYKYLDHFTVEPSIINRNGIVHGMGKWIVTNKDCIQLFLLYRNILFLIARIDSSSKEAAQP